MLLNLDRHIRCALSRFRFGVSDIAVHSTRFKKSNTEDTECPLCNLTIETEIHFVLCCPALNDLRKRFIQTKFCDLLDTFHLVQLLSSSDHNILKNLAMFLYEAFKRRRTISDVYNHSNVN